MGKLLERRYLNIADVELRSAEDSLTLEGYASVFGSEAVIWDSWIEEVASGAYTKTIREADIRALFNHDPNAVLGRNKAGTLELTEDSHGLWAVIEAPDNEWGRPVVDAVRRGDVTGMSISFSAVKDEWVHPPEDSGELSRRIIREARLYDVGPVTFPAFEATTIAARSANGAENEIEDVLIAGRRIELCAAHGMQLRDSDREVLAQAVAILTERLAESEPPTDTGHSQDEPGAEGLYSAAARERWLALVQREFEMQ